MNFNDKFASNNSPVMFVRESKVKAHLHANGLVIDWVAYQWNLHPRVMTIKVGSSGIIFVNSVFMLSLYIQSYGGDKEP